MRCPDILTVGPLYIFYLIKMVFYGGGGVLIHKICIHTDFTRCYPQQIALYYITISIPVYPSTECLAACKLSNVNVMIYITALRVDNLAWGALEPIIFIINIYYIWQNSLCNFLTYIETLPVQSNTEFIAITSSFFF